MKDNFKYYIDYFTNEFLNLETNRPWLSFDSEGVVVSSLERLKSKFNLNIPLDKEYFYHPCEIAQAVCAYYDLYKETGYEEYKNKLINNANWLEKNYVEYKNSYVYPFPYAIQSFGENPGWISGMYQGIILSSFVRAYLIVKDKKYLVFAEKVYNSYSLNIGDKYGFKVEDKYGLWFEESMLNPPTHIFNGFAYAIFGLFDYYKLTQRKDVEKKIKRCFDTLVKALPEYDMGYWSYYDLKGTIASYSYHNKMHVPILKALYELSGEEIFNEFGQRWAYYGTSQICRFRKKLLVLKRLLYSSHFI